jgi:CHAT domain-containing protein
MRAAGFTLLFCGLAIGATAQHIVRLADRHARINALYEAEKYAETVKEIDAQLKEAPGTTYADSLHRYLYKYGRAHRKLKDAAAGTAAAERIYALIKQRGNANNELEALFDLSWTYYDVGEMKQCARVDSIAVTVADGDPKVPISQRGRARQYLAFDYSVIGDHRNSAKYALAALDQYAKADSIPPAQWAESYTAVGVAYWHMGRIRDAEAQYMKALEVLGDGTAEAILIRKVSTNGNLGVMWQNAGDFTRAKSYYHESLRNSDRVIAAVSDQFTRDEAIVNRSRTYLNLATVYQQMGDEGRARDLLEIAWNDRSKVLEPDDPQLLVVRDRMADLELSSGALDKADELVSAYLAACEKKFGKRSEEYIRACSKLGDIALRKGETARADSLYKVSIAAGLLNTDASTDAVLALTLQGRARMNVKAGRFAEATKDLQEARSILVNIYDSTHYKIAHCDVLLAEAAFNGGDAAAALMFSQRACGLLKDRARAIKATTVPQTFPDPHILPDAIYWKVQAERMLRSSLAPKKQWNDDLDLAILSLARNKAAVKDEASQLLLIGAQKRLFDLAMDLTYEAYEQSGSEVDIERFLALSEADRSILLKSRLNMFAGLRFAGVPDSILTKEQELLNALDIDEDDRASATDMDRREKAYSDFLSRLQKEQPTYFNLRYGEQRITLGGIREKLLTADRQVLAYSMTDDHLYMLVISMDTAALMVVPTAVFSGTVKALNAAIVERRQESYVRLAGVLYAKVFEPVAGMLRRPELLIIPDGDLQTVNFETLLFEPTDRGKLSAHMLIQKYTIAYLLSATTAMQFADLARDHSRGALAIAPGFDEELKKAYAASVSDTTQLDRDYLRYVRQPFAISTAQGLGPLLSAKVMLGGDASEKGFRDVAAQYGILHLGTHAEMNAASPMYSRLVLSKDGSGVDADADGYLHAYEIYELDLRAQLAVLTACETGIGKDDEGEGVRSLGYSFAYAGCPSLVMSLWSIDEKVSSEIIARFYEHLADGLPKHKALRQAKLDHLSTAADELALPFYWAGMVLVGDVAPVEAGASNSWPWAIGAAALLIAVGLWLRRRRPWANRA